MHEDLELEAICDAIAAKRILPARALVASYAAAHYPDFQATLMRAYEMRRLAILIDGVEESDELSEQLKRSILEFQAGGHPLVVTSRPEGIDPMFLNRPGFVCLTLQHLTSEQQQSVIKQRLNIHPFFNSLLACVNIRQRHDSLYHEVLDYGARHGLEKIRAPNRLIGKDHKYDASMRHDHEGAPIARRGLASLQSKQLKACCKLFTPQILKALEEELTVASTADDPACLAAFKVEERLGDAATFSPKERQLTVKLANFVLRRRANPDELELGATTVPALWSVICERTDMLYEASEALYGVAQSVVNMLVAGIEGVELKWSDGFKDPVRLHEKALDNYADRFEQGLAEACVMDVMRCRIIVMDAASMLQLIKKLLRGFSSTVQGQQASVSVVLLLNHFAELDPLHFRNFLINLRLKWGSGPQVRLTIRRFYLSANATCLLIALLQARRTFFEVQLHHRAIVDWHELSHAHEPYSYLRSLLSPRFSATDSLFSRLTRNVGLPHCALRPLHHPLLCVRQDAQLPARGVRGADAALNDDLPLRAWCRRPVLDTRASEQPQYAV